jgi:hypothetical protein
MWLHDVLTRQECELILEESLKYHESSPGGEEETSEADYTQPGIRSQFCSDDPEFSALLWERIKGALPAELDGGRAAGLMTNIAHARYWTGQVGFPHMDFRHGPRGQENISSRVSFTVYLNDDYEGGELSFAAELNMDGSVGGEHSRCKPRAGSAVLFYQGVPEFAHVPHKITKGCKSIMRADVLYEFENKQAADVGCHKVN